VAAWRIALERDNAPTALLLTRQNLPTLDGVQTDGVRRGGYVLSDDGGTPDILLMASGSEVQHIVEAAATLRSEGRRVRVVSFTSWELFEEQPEAYRNEVLPPAVTGRIAMEAGITMGWERYVGLEGRVLGLDRFGSSAPGDVLMEKFGFVPDTVVEAARQLLED
jgi:transketolase